MLLDLTSVATECICCARTDRLDRHHRGCEKMFVRHFKRQRQRTLKYQAFARRYWEFRSEDCVPLCRECHEEAHCPEGPYANVIRRAVLKIKKPMCRWTWLQAEILMRDCRLAFDQWAAARRESYLHGAIRKAV